MYQLIVVPLINTQRQKNRFGFSALCNTYLLRVDVPICAAAARYVVHDTLEEVCAERVQVYLTASLASAIMTSNSNKYCNNVKYTVLEDQ